MKILFSCGNAPGLPTGYGGQGLLAVEAIQTFHNSQVIILAWNLSPQIFTPFQSYSTEEVVRNQPGMQKIFETASSSKINWSSIQWYSNPYTQFPTPIRKQDINRMICDCNADLFLSLQDIFMFEPGPFACLSAVWMPLHFVPVEHPTVMALSDFDIHLPISGWGAMLLHPLQSKNALRHVEVVAHGKDIQIFNETRKTSKIIKETRLKWGMPQNAFVILLIASNSEESGRKAFDAQLQAYSYFVKEHPELNPWLHIHSESVRAYDLGRLLETFGLFSERSRWIDKSDMRIRTIRDAPIVTETCSITSSHDLMGISEEELVNLYYASDVLLSASCSEGCGVPILEAQLCGTPVITTAKTAMWEETMYGISVKPLQWIARMDFNSGWYVPDARGIANALYTIASYTDDQKKDFLKVKQKLIDNYSNEAIIKSFHSVFTKITTKTLTLNPERYFLIQEMKALKIKLNHLKKLNSQKQELSDFIQKQILEASVHSELKSLL